MPAGNLVLTFMAGIVSILSPCVLPLLPVVLGTAASDHKFGPVALATGLLISFVTIGLLVASIGYSVGLNEVVFRYAAAVLIIAIGAVLVLPALQTRLAVASGPIANWTDRRFGNPHGSGVSGQFWVGILLGAVWSPCVGPTLGAASLLAAQGRDLPQVGFTMFVFGLGAALPLLVLGLFTREAVMRWRHRLLSAGHGVKVALGLSFVAIGALVLSGFDKAIETALVDASPPWLTNLTTRC